MIIEIFAARELAWRVDKLISFDLGSLEASLEIWVVGCLLLELVVSVVIRSLLLRNRASFNVGK